MILLQLIVHYLYLCASIYVCLSSNSVLKEIAEWNSVRHSVILARSFVILASAFLSSSGLVLIWVVLNSLLDVLDGLSIDQFLSLAILEQLVEGSCSFEGLLELLSIYKSKLSIIRISRDQQKESVHSKI